MEWVSNRSECCGDNKKRYQCKERESCSRVGDQQGNQPSSFAAHCCSSLVQTNNVVETISYLCVIPEKREKKSSPVPTGCRRTNRSHGRTYYVKRRTKAKAAATAGSRRPNQRRRRRIGEWWFGEQHSRPTCASRSANLERER